MSLVNLEETAKCTPLKTKEGVAQLASAKYQSFGTVSTFCVLHSHTATLQADVYSTGQLLFTKGRIRNAAVSADKPWH